MLRIEEVPDLYLNYKSRYIERDERMELLDKVVRGDFNVFDPEEEEIESRSPNLIQVALEDTAEAAALVPTVRVNPPRATQRGKKMAARMERVGVSYLQASKVDSLLIQTILDLAGFGYGVWVVWPDRKQRIPLIEKRDPRTAYPEPGHRPGERCRNIIFARDLYFSQLPRDWRVKILPDQDPDEDGLNKNVKVTLVEYMSDEEFLIAALWDTGTGGAAVSADRYMPVELERWDNVTGKCPAIVGSRFTLDGEWRGQFDQVVGVLKAHVRLMGVIMDYADQAVYSDVWVKDLIGEMPWGGGSYIELGPNGAIGRVPPAVNSFNVQQDLANLVDAFHVGGRWPKTRPGEVDQSIASAKFLEASAGMMNTAIKTYHQIMRGMLEQALQVAFEIDHVFFPGEKAAAGILRNQEFLEEYDAATDIDPDFRVRVEYGLGLGRDPSQSAVLHIQYHQAGFISQETVQENIEGLSDIARENARIDARQLKDMVKAKLLQLVEAGMIDDEALIEIAAAREQGEDLLELYRKYVVQPRQEQRASLVDTGLGPPMAPGLGPEAAAGPIGPDGLPVGGGTAGVPPGPGVPPAPDPVSLLARLSAPAGPGGVIGTQVS